MILFKFIRIDLVRSLKYRARKVYRETDNFIRTIKMIRAETNWGLRESKNYFDKHIRKDI